MINHLIAPQRLYMLIEIVIWNSNFHLMITSRSMKFKISSQSLLNKTLEILIEMNPSFIMPNYLMSQLKLFQELKVSILAKLNLKSYSPLDIYLILCLDLMLLLRMMVVMRLMMLKIKRNLSLLKAILSIMLRKFKRRPNH